MMTMENQHMTLFIEDNPGDLFILKEQLESAGWPVQNSYHTIKLFDAVESLKNIQPTIVFLDLNLPDSNGLETFLTINSMAPDTPIIILSGMNDTSLCVQAVKAGAQDFLVKGEFEEKLLLKTILYGIERKKNQIRIEEANKRYTLAVKATNDPLWDWDMKTNEIFWNDKVSIFGYKDVKRKNKSWRMINIHYEDRERVRATLEEYIASGKENCHCEYRFVCEDGTIKHIFDRGYILRDRNNVPYRMIGTMQDLTDKFLTQQQRDEENKLHQQAILKANIDGQEKERDFISKELHDNINQILTSANIYLGLIKPSEDDKTLEAIKTTRTYINAAIEEIRKLSRSMSASQIQNIGLLEAIEDIKEKINLLEVCKIRFVHSGDTTTIPWDISLAIYRIIQEQINNIIKHAKATNAVISLDTEENKVMLHISDNGVGANLTAENKLKGIGLSNIDNRVHAYNGTIKIETSANNGFDMYVEFPIV